MVIHLAYAVASLVRLAIRTSRTTAATEPSRDTARAPETPYTYLRLRAVAGGSSHVEPCDQVAIAALLAARGYDVRTSTRELVVRDAVLPRDLVHVVARGPSPWRPEDLSLLVYDLHAVPAVIGSLAILFGPITTAAS